MSKAVVLLSGGLDSTTALAQALNDVGSVLPISFLYGQRHSVEVQQAKKIAAHYGVQHRTIQLPEIFHGAGSLLTDEGDMPHMTYDELAQQEGPSPTYVPFRNGNMIAQAVAYALTHDANEVYIASHAEDAHNFAYPDCTPEFNGAMAAAVYVGTYHKVRLVFPFQFMEKYQIIHRAIALRAPLTMTHSCYEGVRPACGTCPTCVARVASFQRAGYIDPIEYEVLPTLSGREVG